MRRPLLALALVLAGLLVPARASSVTMSEWSTRFWAQAYGLDPDWLWSVALCESSGSVWARNGQHFGLFQFLPSTYAQQRYRLNQDPTMAPHLTTFDPESRDLEVDDGASDAHVAAWSFAHGYAYLWQCR